MQAPIEVGSKIVERPSKEVVVSISQSSDIPPEKLQMLTDLFALADGDGSGSIDAKELGELLSEFSPRLPLPRQRDALCGCVASTHRAAKPKPTVEWPVSWPNGVRWGDAWYRWHSGRRSSGDGRRALHL